MPTSIALDVQAGLVPRVLASPSSATKMMRLSSSPSRSASRLNFRKWLCSFWDHTQANMHTVSSLRMVLMLRLIWITKKRRHCGGKRVGAGWRRLKLRLTGHLMKIKSSAS